MKRPIVLSARASPAEAAVVRAAAEAAGVRVNEWARVALLRAAARELAPEDEKRPPGGAALPGRRH